MLKTPLDWSSAEASRRALGLRPDFAAAIERAAVEKKDTIADFWLNVRPDPIDFRDASYVPGLVEIKPFLDPAWPHRPELVRNQGAEGSCTGQALAAVIDAQNHRRREMLHAKHGDGANMDALIPERVSARMLYEMARAYDEFPEDGLPGSSARGAIKAFFHNGVCSEASAPYIASEPGWRLTVPMAKQARSTSLGAYFRLRHVLYDYHAALNEVGALFVSAMVHEGWQVPQNGKIKLDSRPKLKGAHAFALVGYDADGFYVLNSWGPNWGSGGAQHVGPGIAHWSYADWKEHVLDAWVLRLAVPSPETFHLVGGFGRKGRPEGRPASVAVPRIEINGHYIHVNNGQFVRSGNYPNDVTSFEQTAARLIEKKNGALPYDHLLFYAHGGLNDLDDAAARTATLTPVFKEHKIYPVFYLWRTGFREELIDVLFGRSRGIVERTQGLSDLTDDLLEPVARTLVRPVWTEMKNDARRAMAKPPAPAGAAALGGDAWLATRILLDAARTAGMKVHLVGHSAGANFVGELMQQTRHDKWPLGSLLATTTLFAAACTETFFNESYASVPKTSGTMTPDVVAYNLSDRLERDDAVGPYRKSLLYLIANALEQTHGTRIAGRETVAKGIATNRGKMVVHISDGVSGNVTRASAHGDFDNDATTLNHVLNRVLGHSPAKVGPSNGGFFDGLFKN